MFTLCMLFLATPGLLGCHAATSAQGAQGNASVQDSWIVKVAGQHKSAAEKVLGTGKQLPGVGYFDQLAKQVRRIGESFEGYSMEGLKKVTVGYGFTEKDYQGEFQVLLLNVYLNSKPKDWQDALAAVHMPSTGVVSRKRAISATTYEVDLKQLPGLSKDWYAVFQSSPAGAELHFVHPEFQSDPVKEWMHG